MLKWPKRANYAQNSASGRKQSLCTDSFIFLFFLGWLGWVVFNVFFPGFGQTKRDFNFILILGAKI